MYFRDVVAWLTQNNREAKWEEVKQYITMSSTLLTILRSKLFKKLQQHFKNYDILSNQKLLSGVCQQVLQCFINPVLVYGCETWTFNKTIMKKLEVFEMVSQKDDAHFMD